MSGPYWRPGARRVLTRWLVTRKHSADRARAAHLVAFPHTRICADLVRQAIDAHGAGIVALLGPLRRSPTMKSSCATGP